MKTFQQKKSKRIVKKQYKFSYYIKRLLSDPRGYALYQKFEFIEFFPFYFQLKIVA